MAEKEALLGAKLGGTARRRVREGTLDRMAIAELREIAGGNVTVLRAEAALAIGGWLGQPSAAADLKVAYLLLEAADVGILDGPAFVDQVDVVRRRVAEPRHGSGAAHGDRPPT